MRLVLIGICRKGEKKFTIKTLETAIDSGDDKFHDYMEEYRKKPVISNYGNIINNTPTR